MVSQIKNIVILGSGNVAWHLAIALKMANLDVKQVFGRNEADLIKFKKEIDCDFTTKYKNIFPDADLYIIALTENAIPEILEKIRFNNRLIVHTAGSAPMYILKPYSENFGVFYPLQTFSKKDTLEYDDIPFCLEANTPENLEKLIGLAKKISNDVRTIDSDQRKILHLAAVFACNFPNYLYIIAEQILKENALDFDILLPLIKRTTTKITKASPAEVQTGPATRKDMETINKHIDLLKDKPEFREIYKVISEAIGGYQ